MKNTAQSLFDCNTSTDHQCSDQEYRTHIYSNPDALWDMFPCPPPWKPELILELPWKERLGDEDGDRLCTKVANRCGLDLHKLQALALQDSLIFSDCDIKCFIGLLVGFLVTVCLCVAIVTFFIRRRKKSPKIPHHKDTRVILTTNGVHTKLMNGESSPIEKKEKSNFDFSRFWCRSNIYESDDVKRHRSDISENESLTYSGGDTSHTYESVNTSDKSSYRMSDSSRNPRLSEEIMLELKEKYSFRNSDSSHSYQPQRVTSPVSNLLYEMRSPNQPVSNALYQTRRCQCGACSLQSTNHIPRNCPCNICNQSNSSIPYRGQFIDIGQNYNVQQLNAYPSSCHCYPRYIEEHNLKGHLEFENFPYADDKIHSGVQSHSLYYTDKENTNFRLNSGCSCKQCAQQRFTVSDEGHSTYSVESDIYGVPKTDLKYPREIHCNCRQCTKMIPITTYTKRLSRTGEYSQMDNAEMQFISTDDIVDSDGPEHRKRRRSKPRPPISSTASSSDNTGSEKSFRSGKLKTNGSLFNSKLISR
ncbi:uncharacterized protein LOC125650335 isoform X3 [Ostrea edulis]|uniref:uncharacterized protein LOC125650335 isoform X3 n=1 Tax=Ostrea edulis TaxID=37623 RepID=UPI0024AF8648|nr:uncharacterized protein LOC125650335 isoform X3 [Ostrea edulis]